LFGEELADDFFDGEFLDADVGDFAGGEDGAAGLGDAAAGDAQADVGGAAFDDFAEGGEVAGGGAVFEGEVEDFVGSEAVDDRAQRAIEEDAAFIDDDDPFAELLDVLHVVAGEHGDDAVAGIVFAQELADFFLAGDVEADGGLIEEEHAGRVEEGGDELHLHAFAEGKLADHDIEMAADVEQGGELVDDAGVARFVDAVDGAIELEGFAGGEVPPEGVFLAHEEGELPLHFIVALPGDEAEHAGGAGRGIEEAGEHFQDGGLAGAVGAEKADEFAFLDGEGDVVRGAHVLVFAPAEALDGAEDARRFFVGPIHFGQSLGFDGAHAGGRHCLTRGARRKENEERRAGWGGFLPLPRLRAVAGTIRRAAF
jgi:hypothetical protein